VVLAPWRPQEAYELTIEAFNIAEELRVPVIILSDEFIGHGREVVEAPEEAAVKSRRTELAPGEAPFDSRDPRGADRERNLSAIRVGYRVCASEALGKASP
jgi:2-oxoglutarate ferredoxin oxidoreductase subunit alpha